MDGGNVPGEKLQAFFNNEDIPPDELRAALSEVLESCAQKDSELERLRKDLDAERDENQRLESLSRLNHDTLLPLAREFMRELGELIELRREMHTQDDQEPLKPFAVAHIKLDENFRQMTSEQTKQILGFKTATILRDMEMLKDNIYQGDRIEDFLIILPNVRNIEAAEFVIDELVIPAVSQPHMLGENDIIQFSCNTAVAVFPFHGTSFQDLNANLEIAMARSLKTKSTIMLYSDHLGEDHRHRMQVRKELRKARNNGFEGFELRFQPFVNEKGKIVGCETLVRWNHPQLGFLSPNLFIKLAEESGEMDMLGRWILYRACLEFKQWKKAGSDIKYVSVNLSPVQFGREGLVESIVGMLKALGLKGGELKLEITEGTIMRDPLESIAILNKFRAHGVRIAIDDFGTGYSSLNYLMRLPINTLKIDKSFVDDILSNTGNRVVVKSIIDLARNLNLEILAEGVESKEQKDYLFEEGIQYIQGYYYSAPITGEEFAKLLFDNNYPEK